MRKLVAACAALGLMLACAGVASANLSVGVNDDAAKDAGISSWFYSTMQSEGLTVNALTLRWDEGSPTTVPDVAAVNQAVAKAKANGVTIELDLYPLHSQVFTGGARCAVSSDPEACGDTAKIQQFAQWTALVAKTFPTVHEFVVMNECNQPLFVNPQWDASGNNASAEICGRALAASYDALHAQSSDNFVWGIGLSPRGNDSPNAKSNSSTTPIKFIAALGAWFKAFAAKTNRTAPLMDGLDVHPYPVPQTLPFATGYANPLEFSVTNLPRVYQAFYSAFAGSPQKTIGQQAGGGLPVSLNETGIQTDSTGKGDYVGTEVSATSAGGVSGSFATEEYQAQWYGQMLNLVACDPNVQVVNIFHLIDEPSLNGWQSGLYYYSATSPQPKQSALTVKNFIAGGSKCSGQMQPWTPAGVPAASTTTAPKPAKTPPTPCTKAGATKAKCAAFLKFEATVLAQLQAQLKHASLKVKVALRKKIAAEKRAVAAAKAALKKLKV